jgi:hypothetical protein
MTSSAYQTPADASYADGNASVKDIATGWKA